MVQQDRLPFSHGSSFSNRYSNSENSVIKICLFMVFHSSVQYFLAQSCFKRCERAASVSRILWKAIIAFRQLLSKLLNNLIYFYFSTSGSHSWKRKSFPWILFKIAAHVSFKRISHEFSICQIHTWVITNITASICMNLIGSVFEDSVVF